MHADVVPCSPSCVYSFLQKLMKATLGFRKAKLDGKGIIKYSIDTIMTTKKQISSSAKLIY